MANIRYLTDGLDLKQPRNWRELEITFEFLNKKEVGAINTTSLEFVGEAHRHLRQRFLNGMSGGVGIFEGVPIKIEVGETGNPVFTFDGYLDGTDETTFIGNEEIIAKVKKQAGDDWLNDVADGFSFAYLNSIGEITEADYIKVPYVINYVPDGLQLIMLSMSLFMMSKELIENSKELAELIGLTVNAATPVIGVSVGVGAGVVTAWDLGDWIMYGLYVLAKLLYIIAITIAIVKLIEQLIEQLFPKMRYHKGMTIYSLFQKGCAHLNLGFQSTLLEAIKDEVVIPSKDRKGGDGDTGHPTNIDPIYTFGDCIRVFMARHNAEYKIIDGVFIFERKDYWQNLNGEVLPAVFTDQKRLLNSFVPNTQEFKANYNIHYQYDTQDQNTLDDTTGLTFQAITKPNVVNNPKLVNMKGLEEISIPFALGKRKDEFTTLEKFARDVFKFVDNLTGIFGGGTNFANKIEARIGALLLSSHFISVPKIVKMSGGKLAPNQREQLGADKLWDLYHFINSFAEINGIHNQYLRYPPVRIPITEQQILTIFENHFTTTPDGKRAMIERLVWQPYKGTAIVSYRVNEKYTENLNVNFIR